MLPAGPATTMRRRTEAGGEPARAFGFGGNSGGGVMTCQRDGTLNVSTHGVVGIREDAASRETPDTAFTIEPAAV